MPNNQKIQSGINSVSNEWFRANIDRKILKNLSRRNDWPAWRHMLIFFLSLIVLGWLCAFFWSSWLFIPIYLAYCTLYAGADAIWHECGHRTAFKSRRLNDFFYYIGSFLNNKEPVRWRWSHSLHHSYTASIDPHDYEVDGSIFSKQNLFSFLLRFIPGIDIFQINNSLQKEIIQHAMGIETKVMKDCIPADEQKKCILFSRIYVFLWILIILLAIYLKSFLPIFLFLLPYLFDNLNRVWGLTQHMGLKEDTKDHRLYN